MDRTYENRFEDRIETSEDLRLVFDERASGSLVIFLNGHPDHVSIHFTAKPYSYVKVFIQNRTESALHLDLQAEIDTDARLDLGFLDLQDEPVELKAAGNLNSQGATMEFYSAQLCLFEKMKKGNVDINSNVPHTYGNIHNFSVVMDGGQYEMVAAGRIVKGARNSESHQETRVLTMGTRHKCLAIPILYIDENDVKASHALTVGQPDEDQLYYLRSRGLNTRQAMGLLSIGYFKPVLSLIADESLREALDRETEERVGLYEH